MYQERGRLSLYRTLPERCSPAPRPSGTVPIQPGPVGFPRLVGQSPGGPSSASPAPPALSSRCRSPSRNNEADRRSTRWRPARVSPMRPLSVARDNCRWMCAPPSPRGTSAWPRVRVVARSECGTTRSATRASGAVTPTSAPPGGGSSARWGGVPSCSGIAASTAVPPSRRRGRQARISSGDSRSPTPPCLGGGAPATIAAVGAGKPRWCASSAPPSTIRPARATASSTGSSPRCSTRASSPSRSWRWPTMRAGCSRWRRTRPRPTSAPPPRSVAAKRSASSRKSTLCRRPLPGARGDGRRRPCRRTGPDAPHPRGLPDFQRAAPAEHARL